MKTKIALDEIQGIELDILKKVINYFEKNHINYFTSGGTTLGSIRHQGFIPWDDDIDLYVPRKDYDRLMEISDGVLIDDYISIKKPGDKDYPYQFVKAVNEKTVIYERSITDEKYAIGLFVDIFPLDNHYDSKLKNYFLIKKSRWYRSLLEVVSSQKNLSKEGSTRYKLKELLRTLQKPISKKWTVEELTKYVDNLGRKLNNKDSNFVGNFVMKGYGNKDYYKKEYFEKAVIGKFEDIDINNPIGYDKYLTEMYGDYMTLPPEEKRIMHGFNAWYK